MKSNEQIKKDIFTYGGWSLIVVLAIIIPGLIFESGYSLNGLKISKPGKIIIQNFPEDGEIYLNGKKTGYITEESLSDTVVIEKVKADEHEIIVSKQGYYPWTEKFTLKSNQTLTLKVFNVLQNQSGEIVGSNDPDYYKIISSIRENSLPTSNNPKISQDGKVSVYSEGANIKAKWLRKGEKPIKAFCSNEGCLDEITITNITSGIKNVEFLNNRNDVIVFSSGNSINVIELDKNGIQNFQPAFAGTDPKFFKDKDGTFYIEDNNTIYHIGI